MAAIRLNNNEFLERLRTSPKWRLQLNRDTNRLNLTIEDGVRITVYEGEDFTEVDAISYSMFMNELNFIVQNGPYADVENDDAA